MIYIIILIFININIHINTYLILFIYDLSPDIFVLCISHQEVVENESKAIQTTSV